MKLQQVVAGLGLALLLAAANARAEDLSCDPDLPAYGDYCAVAIAGWRVELSSAVMAKPVLAKRVADMLRTKLSDIAAVVSGQRLSELRRTAFWVDESVPGTKRLFYRPAGSSWPKENGRPPAMTGGIHITDAEEFLRISAKSQPWALMHELAHAYHQGVLGYNNASISRAFRNARESGLYREVARNNGRKEKAYALTNDHEYFAELSEAYFGENDFYPFTRADLQAYDPMGYEAVSKIWQDQPAQPVYALFTSGCSSSGVVACCSPVGAMASLRGGQPAQFAIRNTLDKLATIYWVDFQGDRKVWGEIAAGALYKLEKSFARHLWMLTDSTGECLALFRLEDSTAFFTLRR